ncbi:plasmid mobilization protein [Microbacterium rhizomatis]|uniref:MobC family plasmid mobilization relaxosome protein n=1 Tax=Microbacterium rhizomatis TaxID=1631477 RepID=A0A5J5IVR7_9MICO|nr:plasmid mobilization relaxosome protein MobC [Microbacterium rhizomatis]KAA9104516.1 MobC family plasmid mobilization relaxosome protein [Microbacterium rhizomatis]
MAEQNERRLFGRQRRANSDTPRNAGRYVVKTNAEEDAQLRARAVVAGVTVPRFLVEAGMNANVETSTERKQTIAELFALSRTLGTVANNVNQLARYANTEGRFPAEAEGVVAEYRDLSARIDETIRRLAGA